MTVVLALDIAKNRTGWAVGGASWKLPKWGTFETERFDDRPGYWLKKWHDFLLMMIHDHHVSMIAVETFFIDLRDFSFQGTVPMAQMHGIVHLVIELKGLRGGEASSSSWRKRFLGVGEAPKWIPPKKRTEWWKKQALGMAIERGWYVTYHDEAEALGLLDFTLCSVDSLYAGRTDPLFRRVEMRQDLARVRKGA
jgi:Holliday junction resolvasome RuvABC endonuclease subunit